MQYHAKNFDSRNVVGPFLFDQFSVPKNAPFLSAGFIWYAYREFGVAVSEQSSTPYESLTSEFFIPLMMARKRHDSLFRKIEIVCFGVYYPDFLVKVSKNRIFVVETKGQEVSVMAP